jgi:hypothetical protein
VIGGAVHGAAQAKKLAEAQGYPARTLKNDWPEVQFCSENQREFISG